MGWEGQANEMQVFVRDNDINSALRVLKRKMQREGLFRELRRRRAYEKPSERRARQRAEGGRRRRKALTKRMTKTYSAAHFRHSLVTINLVGTSSQNDGQLLQATYRWRATLTLAQVR